MRLFLLCLSLLLTASPPLSQELGLAAPAPVAQSGLLKHILPRFSLKTGVRVVPDPAGPMILAEEAPGTPVFTDGTTLYHLRIGDDPRQQRFRDWLISDIGKRTVESFAPEGIALYSASVTQVAKETARDFKGDAMHGAELALIHCGRCHVVGAANRMSGLGSTPSFMVLRAFPDWIDRFESFYALNPHPSFTRIDGVSAPFDPTRPPPIVPLRITLDDLDAILAFVAQTEAADLGAPLQLQ